jgi:hypothetical protein
MIPHEAPAARDLDNFIPIREARRELSRIGVGRNPVAVRREDQAKRSVQNGLIAIDNSSDAEIARCVSSACQLVDCVVTFTDATQRISR